MDQSFRPDSLRRQLAAAAAKLISEGEPDYRRALAKTAESFDPHHAADWPSLEELDTAVAAHQSLFPRSQRTEDLRAVRLSALALMRELTIYKPRLFGPAATGTAIAQSDIWLELAASPLDSKEFEIELLNRGWTFEAMGGEISMKHPSKSRPPLTYRLVWRGQEALVTLAGERFEAANREWTHRLDIRQLASLLNENPPIEC